MKSTIIRSLMLIAIMFTMNSCSPDSADSSDVSSTIASTSTLVKYSYSASELETLNLINTYRVSIGLNALEKNDYVSFKSEEHDNYMITNNIVSHNDFVARSEDIMKKVGAKSVSENIAFNYNSPQGAVDAWLKSPSHRENIEGNFTHFGIAIRENPATGKKYYTNIFIKI
ncbi:CAP domain-containing protein [Flavobacterium lacustre]|uniref:CAP domain-containing protein n=1 Tax=Flavobacterium lacustre TaxID=3016339 RepID=UPI0022B63F2C|nr:CAP domain-containing protein [Flavobacterium lacustre]